MSRSEAVPAPKLAKVNDRGQISLGSFAQYEYYMITEGDEGDIILKAMVVRPLKRP